MEKAFPKPGVHSKILIVSAFEIKDAELTKRELSYSSVKIDLSIWLPNDSVDETTTANWIE
jgi:hypothetical protein